MKNSTTKVPVPLSDKNIAWKSDRENKFNNGGKNLTAELQKFAKPPRWTKPIWQMKDGLKNQDFIVWMRVASFPTFRKLHRIINNGLAAGSYEIEINNCILSKQSFRALCACVYWFSNFLSYVKTFSSLYVHRICRRNLIPIMFFLKSSETVE